VVDSGVAVPQGLGPINQTYTFVSSEVKRETVKDICPTMGACDSFLLSGSEQDACVYSDARNSLFVISIFPNDNSTVVANLVTLYKANENVSGGLDIFQHPDTYVTQIQNATTKAAQSAAKPAATAANNASVAGAVQNRTDQQTTAPAGSPGSTSTTSQGSVPSLLSIANRDGCLDAVREWQYDYGASECAKCDQGDQWHEVYGLLS